MANRNDENANHNAPRPETEEVNRSGGQSHASADQGGTTDLKTTSVTPGQTAATERGSGISTKRNVTGSDYDGQGSL